MTVVCYFFSCWDRRSFPGRVSIFKDTKHFRTVRDYDERRQFTFVLDYHMLLVVSGLQVCCDVGFVTP